MTFTTHPNAIPRLGETWRFTTSDGGASSTWRVDGIAGNGWSGYWVEMRCQDDVPGKQGRCVRGYDASWFHADCWQLVVPAENLAKTQPVQNPD